MSTYNTVARTRKIHKELVGLQKWENSTKPDGWILNETNIFLVWSKKAFTDIESECISQMLSQIHSDSPFFNIIEVYTLLFRLHWMKGDHESAKSFIESALYIPVITSEDRVRNLEAHELYSMFLMERNIAAINKSKQQTNYPTHSHWMENGVPQGSALSVTLFLVAINKIDKQCNFPIKSNIFADDANFHCRSNNIKTVQYHLQETAKHLEKWSAKTGFSFSIEKSNCITFTRKSNVGELIIKMEDKTIPNKKCIKILGITFDSRLTWSQHIKSLKISTNKALRIIKLLFHTNWGGETETLIKICKATIQAKLYYGSFLYNSAKNTLIKFIDSNHNTGMRMAIGAFKSSPIKSIYNIAGEPTPDLKRRELKLLYAARLTRLTNNPASTNNITLELQKNQNYTKIPQILKKEKIISPPWTSLYKINTELNTLPKENTPPYIYKNLLKYVLENQNEFQELYTDAFKSDEGVGIAIIKNNSQTSFKLPSTCSIYTAEALAILLAIKYINKKENQKHIILSDSLSTLISVQNKFNPSDIAIQIQNRLEEANQKNNNIIIMWVPGHIGIIGNEKADKQAKLAISSPDSQYINISSYSDIRKQIKQDTTLLWQNIWTTQNNKLNEVKQTVKRWRRNPNISTSNEKKLNRARIGHTRLTHEYLMTKSDPPICQSCGTTITIKHIFEECRTYINQRKDLNISHQIGTSLGPNPDNETNTIEFFKTTKLLKLL
ncbi:uncharacterized protein LOC113558217 [Rhopalosiphum maidis]|uniref:uncharacterized protein LOC113558217 n=1 Tax=Rhopalosiphum maidis TaxID=43146 RepID=UPI000F009BC3|nr:uncharacterized protein LOC113558217 [Rhopalosiphum maidis]